MQIRSPGTLTLDAGPVGYKEPRERFEVRLQLDRLHLLLTHTQSAFRISELMRLNRPGDLLAYVDVHTLNLPKRIFQRMDHHRLSIPPNLRNSAEPICGPVSWASFDALHYTGDDDAYAEDLAWSRLKDTPALQDFLSEALLEVLRFQRSLNTADPLIGHVVRQYLARQHPDDFLPLHELIRKDQKVSRAGHTLEFYSELEGLLRDPEIGSAAYRGDGDYSVLRLLATQQRLRGGNARGKALQLAFEVNALVNHPVRNDGWDSRISYFEEGLGHGDLFIETDLVGGAPLGALIARGYRQPSAVVIASSPQTGLHQYDETSGPGWFIYRRRAEHSDSSASGQQPLL